MLIEQENDMNFKMYNLHLNTCKKKKPTHYIEQIEYTSHFHIIIDLCMTRIAA